ncbi:MAG: CopG family transcriptional regulator [Candidatus Dormibacteria bacterium]
MSERTQVLLTPELRGRVERIAARNGMSVGAVIRDAIEAYTSAPGSRSREEALQALLSLGAPVADWDTMKAEIARGARA